MSDVDVSDADLPDIEYTDAELAAPSRGPITDKWAWVMALAPIPSILLGLLALTVDLDNNRTAAVVGVIVTLIALFEDRRILRAHDLHLSIWWGLVLPPFYLWKREETLGRNHAPMLAAWILISAAGVVAAAFIAA